MKKIMFILIFLYPVLVSASNIGQCGSKVFPSRQNFFEQLVIKLKQNPESTRIKKGLTDLAYIAIENFIRIKEPVMEKLYYDLLLHEDFYVQYKSLYALRNCPRLQKEYLLPFLSSHNLLLKDMACSTIAENPDPSFIPVLTSLLASETNIYLKNSIIYAMTRITNHTPLFDFNYGLEQAGLQKYIYYRSGDNILNYQEIYSKMYFNEKERPVADHFIPPIIQYEQELMFDNKRISYGVGGAHTRHAGDDCGWFREGASVHAIGNGIIRLIHHSPDWGFLIVIEHELNNKDYLCSVYGHLAKEIYIQPGEIVHPGQKIGTIGLSYSVENGGYGAHLHFGISKGRWIKSKYNFANQVSIIADGQEKAIKEYKITPQGTELEFENGITLHLQEQGSNLQTGLFWLKGYSLAKDLDRIWLDPQEFLKNSRP